ncbi:hypothetical protein [Paenibacillus sp. S150]|uniref:hypothetical protein n=1 Tax=Paenibacillus sp. S150 TaxID=2749826 RepID=UPI001C560462|nr:hypothetical protein [Paenibacillus sp. S150]MBW4081240.1 hypothetical protein [Paenibacillus sp. S150]
MNKYRFANNKIYYLLTDNLVLVMEASKKKEYSIENIWDYSILYLKDNKTSFEEFNPRTSEETGGYFFKQSDIEQIFQIIINEAPW